MLHVCQLEVHFCEPDKDAFPRPLKLISLIGEVLNRKKGIQVRRLQLLKKMVQGEPSEMCVVSKLLLTLKAPTGHKWQQAVYKNCPPPLVMLEQSVLCQYTICMGERIKLALQYDSTSLYSCFQPVYLLPHH